MAGARKLVVEVVAAKGLMPKDGQGSTNAYCVVGCTSFLFRSLNFSVPKLRFAWQAILLQEV